MESGNEGADGETGSVNPAQTGLNGKSPKKIIRHYEGVNPEVEAELQKVIEELQAKGTENILIKA